MNILNRIIDLSLRNRAIVIAAVAVAAIGGVFALRRLDVDAFPDTTPVQVQINTVAPALARKKSSGRSPFRSSRR